MGIPESTLGIIRKEAEKIKASCRRAMRMIASEITRIRAPIMEKLEEMIV
jgi:hypothetical protein